MKRSGNGLNSRPNAIPMAVGSLLRSIFQGVIVNKPPHVCPFCKWTPITGIVTADGASRPEDLTLQQPCPIHVEVAGLNGLEAAARDLLEGIASGSPTQAQVMSLQNALQVLDSTRSSLRTPDTPTASDPANAEPPA